MRLKSFLFSMAFSILGVIMISTGCNRDAVTPSGITIPTATNTPTPDLTPNPTAAPNSTPIVWPGETISTSSHFQNVTIGSYIVETNYWNPTPCPTMQSVNINTVTGAFNVTAGPTCPNSNTVGSYPNIFFGNELNRISPNSSILPKQVSTLTSVTSSWNFTPGGSLSDSWDIAYDIWFCPNNTCPGAWPCNGTEMMIWVDYLGLSGYQSQVGGPISVGGVQWQLWNQQGGAGTSNTWTELSYLSLTPSADPVNNLDILAFIKNAEAHGLIQPSWYLYSIPAGIELRTGGIPFTSNSFSVQVQ